MAKGEKRGGGTTRREMKNENSWDKKRKLTP
jgi:hypothetical protein